MKVEGEPEPPTLFPSEPAGGPPPGAGERRDIHRADLCDVTQFWDKTEAARNSLSTDVLFSHHLIYIRKELNSKIIILTIKKSPPNKQTKNNTTQNIIFLLYFQEQE